MEIEQEVLEDYNLSFAKESDSDKHRFVKLKSNLYNSLTNAVNHERNRAAASASQSNPIQIGELILDDDNNPVAFVIENITYTFNKDRPGKYTTGFITDYENTSGVAVSTGDLAYFDLDIDADVLNEMERREAQAIIDAAAANKTGIAHYEEIEAHQESHRQQLRDFAIDQRKQQKAKVSRTTQSDEIAEKRVRDMFGGTEYIMKKDLADKCNLPEKQLTEVLKKLCVRINDGEHKNAYTLKDEYKIYQ